MQKVFIILTFILSLNSWALGGYATLSGDDKQLADKIKETLGLSEADTYYLYDVYIRGYLNTKNWHYHTYGNESVTASKLGKSENKTFYINLVTNDRFINVSLIKFSKEKQIQIQAIETLPRSSQIAIDKYNALKNDNNFTLTTDQTEFAVFRRNGYTKSVKTLVYSGSGGIQFTDLYIYDLK